MKSASSKLKKIASFFLLHLSHPLLVVLLGQVVGPVQQGLANDRTVVFVQVRIVKSHIIEYVVELGYN